MSGFELIPMHGGDAIRLPPGETVLGRGPFLRVSDKRVSRHHGLLDNRDGRLRLKPTHWNPCFLQSSPADEPRPLQKDAWRPLGRGDIFSLLPGQLMFRVASADGPPGPSAALAVSRRRSPSPPSGRRGAEPEVSAREAPLAGGTLDDREAEAAVAASPAREKRRRLPLWMTVGVGTSVSPGRQADEKSRRGCRGEDHETKVKRGRKEDGRAVELQQNAPMVTDSPLTNAEEEERERARKGERVAAETKREGGASGGRDIAAGGGPRHASSEAKEKDGSASGRRTACPYGNRCYRKNPLHFRESSHPGDSDYEEEEAAEEEEERPECPYGADCYRKNPLHHQQYRHPKRAVGSRRAASKAGAAPDTDGDSGDSFIDDDSEDVDGDSDYAPPPDSD